MKYYTLSWWAGETEDTQSAFVEYRRYLDSVIGSLPADFGVFPSISACMMLVCGGCISLTAHWSYISTAVVSTRHSEPTLVGDSVSRIVAFAHSPALLIRRLVWGGRTVMATWVMTRPRLSSPAFMSIGCCFPQVLSCMCDLQSFHFGMRTTWPKQSLSLCR